MMAWLRLIATWLVLSGMVVGVLGRADAAHAFMPAVVTTVLDESPIDEEAMQVGWAAAAATQDTYMQPNVLMLQCSPTFLSRQRVNALVASTAASERWVQSFGQHRRTVRQLTATVAAALPSVVACRG